MSSLTIKDVCNATGLKHGTIYSRLRKKNVFPIGKREVLKIVDGVECSWQTDVYDEKQVREVIKW